MENDKIYNRVLEIQKNIGLSSSEQQTEMISELFDIVSQIEKSLDEIKLDTDEIKEDEE